MVYFNCFATIFIVLEGRKVQWRLHFGIPEASLFQWYFVITNLKIKKIREKRNQYGVYKLYSMHYGKTGNFVSFKFYFYFML